MDEHLLKGTWNRIWSAIRSFEDWVFGFFAMIVVLAILSSIPILNFLSLGYLLNASGRVAQTGRIRDGFVGIRKIAILGSMALGIWLVTLPLRFVSEMWKDAMLVAPDSTVANGWYTGLIVLTVLTLWHITWACIRGGRLLHFIWPAPLYFILWVFNSKKYNISFSYNSIAEFLNGLRLDYYFWLGFRGFAGAFLWLLIPVALLILASQLSPGTGVLLSIVGTLMLMVVVMYLPFLQTYFALNNQFSAMFKLKTVRHLFTRAPIAFFLALLITLLFALPLYFLKIELPPREVAWLPSLLFVVFIFPARLLTGWAVSRAEKHPQPRHGIIRWLCRFAILPVAFFYVFFVYFTQYVSWYGSLSLLEQHPFMVPAPLMGL